MNIWAACREEATFLTIEGAAVRIVESQERVATNSLVDSLSEQSLLEEIIERSKPLLPANTEELHYLLSTPFRYPPLPRGSRFGRRFEPSLFYSSQKLTTALSEAAYYHFVFWSGMESPPPSSRLMTQHTVFAAHHKAVTGLQLQHLPFASYGKFLTDPGDYAVTQQLGSAMRAAGVSAFEYISARDPHEGTNVALYTPDVFTNNEPLYQQPWLCETRTDKVTFSGQNAVYQFSLDNYLFDGRFPQPAL
ncbi:MAG: RES family NAD+ phosphorylase [Gammaproteobacteria bacterium]|nr:RES family NAD+ phosphorylase [Gammaproteobacteria bacterium]MCY4283523.1 RES family NAD+ phosphorylase [Gammaproteobacteria bacterium]MCY4337745.1 RES family NAD+ phosphorylase [Gammaproteobacteria bacterium]